MNSLGSFIKHKYTRHYNGKLLQIWPGSYPFHWILLSIQSIYVVKTSSSFHIDFQETLRFDPASFADASDFIKRADNALRTVKPFSFPLSIKDSLSKHNDFQECVCHTLNP